AILHTHGPPVGGPSMDLRPWNLVLWGKKKGRVCVCVCVCIYRPHSCGQAYACRIWLLRSLLLALGVPAPVASGLMAPGPQSGTGRVAMKATGQLANYVHDGPPEGGPVVVLWFIFHIYISNYKGK